MSPSPGFYIQSMVCKWTDIQGNCIPVQQAQGSPWTRLRTLSCATDCCCPLLPRVSHYSCYRSDRVPSDRVPSDKVPSDRVPSDRVQSKIVQSDRVQSDRLSYSRGCVLRRRPEQHENTSFCVLDDGLLMRDWTSGSQKYIRFLCLQLFIIRCCLSL